MTVCPVCAQEWQEKDEACASCGTPKADMEQMLSLAGKVRFLFGTTEMPAVEQEPEQAPKAAAKAKPKAKPKAKKPPAVPVPQPAADADMIVKRDVPVRREPVPIKQNGAVMQHLLAYGLDVLICLFLNYWVIRLILLFSTRSLEDLVTFSLIPVLFVLLFFSFLYFWLFFSLFRKTLGRILLERWRKEPSTLSS